MVAVFFWIRLSFRAVQGIIFSTDIATVPWFLQSIYRWYWVLEV